ncbi:MAG: hypothetical protein ACREMZ_11190 [Gemmatimonadales bacterium]
MTALTPPAQPTNIEEAKSYLAWIAENALTGALDRHHAEAAVKAISAWVRAEDYARQIREIKQQLATLKKSEQRRVG